MEKAEDLVLIIVAAGSSSRFGGGEKQVELLDGLPVFLHSVRNLSPLARATVIAVPRGKTLQYKEIAAANGFALDGLHFVEGGDCRSASVRNALEAASSISRDGIIAIHDAARPLARLEMLRLLVDAARECGGAAPGRRCSDTLLRTDEDGCVLECLPRTGAWQVATPQVFRMRELLMAYAAARDEDFTDDTQVFMRNGGKVRILQENHCNIKITYQDDLEICRGLLAMRR